MRIPFDSLTLAAVVAELQAYVGGRVQGVRQPNETDVALGLYAGGAEAMWMLSCHPEFCRTHFVTRRFSNQPQPPAFLAALRARLDGSSLVSVRQIDSDRILHAEFESDRGSHLLIAELMGKHSNLILLEEGSRIVSAAKWVGRSKSSRPIQSGTKYEPPPVTRAGTTMPTSPFLKKLIEASGEAPVRAAFESGRYHPVLSIGNGAYPLSVAPLGLPELPRATISLALEQHFDQAIPAHEADVLRQSLLGQLQRVVLARDVALNDLRQAEQAGERAGRMQRNGELVLAYGASLFEGAIVLNAFDYDGTAVEIKLNPELDFKGNANAFFDKAKKAKGRMGLVREQIERLDADRTALLALILRVEDEPRLVRLRDLQDEARGKRWLHVQASSGKAKEDRPFEGHRVRELMGPSGFTVYFGENAESNDYLTLRVAKPNDWWLHIRGSTSAHVVVATQNHPEKVSREVLMWAAKLAVENSPSKHAGYVAVDYTLKKYVRKPRGAAKGTALYTNEKTLHVEG